MYFDFMKIYYIITIFLFDDLLMIIQQGLQNNSFHNEFILEITSSLNDGNNTKGRTRWNKKKQNRESKLL